MGLLSYMRKDDVKTT